MKLVTFILCITAFSFTLVGFPSHTYASQTLFTDDFNDGIPDGWDVIGDQGWGVVEGRYGIKLDPGLSNTIPSQENWNSDWQNISFEVDLIGTSGTDKNILIKFENTQNFIELHHTEGRLFLTKVHTKNGSIEVINLSTVNYTLSNGVLYHFKFELNLNRINLWINDELIIDTIETGPPLNDWRIGLRAGTGAISPAEVFFDNIRVTSLDPDFLPVPDVKQTSPPWGGQEYDNASAWVNSGESPTISRWGCALTNAVMILQYHGYEINPESLNNWLLQNNGYVGGQNGGLVSWAAVSSYTKLNNNGTLPSLEFKYINQNINQTISTNLANNIPTILRLTHPNGSTHFVVAKGETGPGDYFINDPFSNSNSLASEALVDYESAIDAVGILTPSQTDTSYIVLSTSADTNIMVSYPDGSTVPNDFFITEYPYMNPETNESLSGAPLKVLYLPKPESGNYKIAVSSSTDATLNSYLYDTNGQSTHQETPLSPGQNNLILNFNKEDSTSSNVGAPNYKHFFEVLDIGFENGKIKHDRIYRTIKSSMKIAEFMNKKERVKIEHFLLNHTERVINRFSPTFIETSLADELLEIIDLIKQT